MEKAQDRQGGEDGRDEIETVPVTPRWLQGEGRCSVHVLRLPPSRSTGERTTELTRAAGGTSSGGGRQEHVRQEGPFPNNRTKEKRQERRRAYAKERRVEAWDMSQVLLESESKAETEARRPRSTTTRTLALLM